MVSVTAESNGDDRAGCEPGSPPGRDPESPDDHHPRRERGGDAGGGNARRLGVVDGGVDAPEVLGSPEVEAEQHPSRPRGSRAVVGGGRVVVVA